MPLSRSPLLQFPQGLIRANPLLIVKIRENPWQGRFSYALPQVLRKNGFATDLRG